LADGREAFDTKTDCLPPSHELLLDERRPCPATWKNDVLPALKRWQDRLVTRFGTLHGFPGVRPGGLDLAAPHLEPMRARPEAGFADFAGGTSGARLRKCLRRKKRAMDGWKRRVGFPLSVSRRGFLEVGG